MLEIIIDQWEKSGRYDVPTEKHEDAALGCFGDKSSKRRIYDSGSRCEERGPSKFLGRLYCRGELRNVIKK